MVSLKVLCCSSTPKKVGGRPKGILVLVQGIGGRPNESRGKY